MKTIFQQDCGLSISGTAATLVIDTARAMHLTLPTLCTAQRMRPRESAHPHISRDQFISLYVQCMRYIYQQHFDSAVLDDRDLFLACIINGKTLLEVIEKGVSFTKHCAMPCRLSLSSEGKDAIFSFDTNVSGHGPHETIIDLFLTSGFYRLMSWMIGESLCASNVNVAQKDSKETLVLNDLFDCQTQFNGSTNSISFPIELLNKPIIRTYREVLNLISISPFELIPLPQPRSLAIQLETLFRKWLIEGKPIPSINDIASMLCQSGSTLRRNLAREGSSFQVLVDKCRKDRAIELLGAEKMTIDEISYNLGYSAPSGFTRAFKDWTGYTPSTYRALANTQQMNEV